MPFSERSRKERGQSPRARLGHAVRRALLLASVGIGLDCATAPGLAIHFTRVLQQIAIAYLISYAVLSRGPRVQIGAIVLVLATYTIAFSLYRPPGAPPPSRRAPPEAAYFYDPVPVSTGEGPWRHRNNLGSRLDDLLLGWNDPRGYSTANAWSSAANMLAGVLVGGLLLSNVSRRRKVLWMAAGAAAVLLAGLALASGGLVPLVKRLWTASFALVSTGATVGLFLGFYLAVDVAGWRRWAFPFVVAGRNSIAAYCLSELLGLPLLAAFLHLPLSPLGAFAPVVAATAALALQWGFLYFLHRRGIYFKL